MVEHRSSEGYAWYGEPFDLKGLLYIGDTLSQKQILPKSLSWINTTISTIQLFGGEDVIYLDMGGI